MFTSMRVSVRLWFPVVVLLINVVIVSLLGAQAVWQTLNLERMDKVKAVTMVGMTTLNHFYQLEQAGTLTRAQAQDGAKAVLRAVRYDQDENIFIYDQQGVNLVHGKKPELEGKNLSGLKDPRGLLLIQRLIEVAQKGGGFVEYGWSRTSGAEPTDKLAYSALFQPWGWMVGTGVYMDDMRGHFLEKLTLFGGAALVLAVLAGALAVAVGRSIANPLGTLMQTMERIAGGDLGSQIAGVDRKDELGAMARALEVFRSHAAERQRLSKKTQRKRGRKKSFKNKLFLPLPVTLKQRLGGLSRRWVRQPTRWKQPPKAWNRPQTRQANSAKRSMMPLLKPRAVLIPLRVRPRNSHPPSGKSRAA